jgi:competence protein ComEA
MRSRKLANEQVAEVARRRLAQLGAELAEIRPEQADADGTAASQRAGASPAMGPGRHAQRSVGLTSTTGGWLHDRLPPTLQGRVGIGPAHLAVVALVVAGSLAVAAWWTVRADGDETVLSPLSSPPSALATPASGSPGGTAPVVEATSPAAAGDARIVVDVAGKVRHPGIATLPQGARVIDALEAAGGVRPGVRAGTTLNLARVLTDGEQIVVGVRAPPGTAASAASAPTAGGAGSTPMVNINLAAPPELEELPGVGPVTAQAIVDYRTENGGFRSVDELMEVSGIGEATLAEMAPFVTL